MLDFLPAPVKGILAITLILLSTLLWYPLLLLLALIKLIIPLKPVRTLATRGLNRIALIWNAGNAAFIRLLNKVEWHVEGLSELSKDQWYFITSNHQSWVDILVVQNLLNSRIPLMKFFLKRELIWVPLLGIAWWALDFPFMKRYSKELLEKRPELKGKDLETTQKACEKFQYTPVAVFNFMEGTRFTEAKHAAQQSPYTNLLRPKAGGTAFVLGAMGERLQNMLDITIVYPDGVGGIWDYLCGRIRRIVVHIDHRQIPNKFLGRDYANDEAFRKDFQQWVSELWQEKDDRIETLKRQYNT